MLIGYVNGKSNTITAVSSFAEIGVCKDETSKKTSATDLVRMQAIANCFKEF